MQLKRIAVGVVAAAAMAGLAACGSGTSTAGGGSTTGAQATTAPMASGPMTSGPMTSAPMASSGGASGAAAPFGSACSAVPSSGAGSFSGMAQDPVATAASNNPALSTLVSAVKAAGLVDTLNNAKNVTVFAPDNAAFAKIPAATLKGVLANKAELTKILTYHVVPKRLTPMDLTTGSFPTVEGATVKSSGSGMAYKVNDANVVCGNVQTANATVYIVDTVLMPTS